MHPQQHCTMMAKTCNVDPMAKYFRYYIISYKYIKHDAEENAALIRWYTPGYTRCIKISYKYTHEEVEIARVPDLW